MSHYTQQLWQITKQISGIVLTLVIIEAIGFELTPIMIIFSWFFFLVPPLDRKQEWQPRRLVAQYGAIITLPVLGMLDSGILGILVWAILVLGIPYLLKISVNFMMMIAVFLIGMEYILVKNPEIWTHLLPVLSVAFVAYVLSRMLLPLGNGWFINHRIYKQTQTIFALTKQNCVDKQLVTIATQRQFQTEYALVQAFVQSYETWGIDVRSRYRQKLPLYTALQHLNDQAVEVLLEINHAQAPEWVKYEFHQAQRIHRLLLELLYQESQSCPILYYEMPKTVFDQQFNHSVAIYALTKYLESLEDVVQIWRKELCHGNNYETTNF